MGTSGTNSALRRRFADRAGENHTPLGDAVRFVDHQQVDVHFLNARSYQLGREPFGREVQQFDIAVDAVVEDAVNVPVVHAGVHCRRRDIALLEVFHLVFHQGNEGRYDNADPFPVVPAPDSKWFPSSCRHEASVSCPSSTEPDDVFLQRAEAIVSPVLP